MVDWTIVVSSFVVAILAALLGAFVVYRLEITANPDARFKWAEITYDVPSAINTY